VARRLSLGDEASYSGIFSLGPKMLMFYHLRHIHLSQTCTAVKVYTAEKKISGLMLLSQN